MTLLLIFKIASNIAFDFETEKSDRKNLKATTIFNILAAYGYSNTHLRDYYVFL